MTNPLNYQGGRRFPQSILDDLDKRLRALEADKNPTVNDAVAVIVPVTGTGATDMQGNQGVTLAHPDAELRALREQVAVLTKELGQAQQDAVNWRERATDPDWLADDPEL
ncbi:hypothetical protein [Paraburkholderia sp.]|uniref:hypothetical protein n=1 Tax=Paraburkholderia sp. TaxID=1926495 RepID=UPI00239B308B|nr:hypothetical protein [Paraburkholderia sp.]MDE1179441.1 hypothetical protein [Paraburkholderia sp.]